MNEPDQTKPFWKRGISPALALWLIAPIFGEMVSGSTPLNEYISPLNILLQGMLYGSGALLIRELLVRWGKSWRGLLLLGAAYGIFEEGLMVRSFFDPAWQDLGALGIYGRVAGVNWVWTEHLIIFHMLISVAASLVFVEILYPDQRAKSWIGPHGLRGNIFALAATLPIGALGVDQYNTPDAWLGMCWLTIALLALAAWRAGHAAVKDMPAVRVPPPWLFWWIGFLGMLGQLLIIYRTAEQTRPPFVVTMLLIALFDLFILWLILRWSGNAKSWDDRHRLALINGALSLFLIGMPLFTNGKYPVMYFSNPVLLVLLWWVSQRVNRRVKAELQSRAITGIPSELASS